MQCVLFIFCLFIVSDNINEMVKAIIEFTLFQKFIVSVLNSVHQLNAISLWWFCK